LSSRSNLTTNISDLLIEVPNARDPSALAKLVDSRLRVGSPRTDQGSTRTDAQFVENMQAALPRAQRPDFRNGTTVLPDSTDPHADVKRSLRWDAPAGFALLTTGQLAKHLGGGEVSRIFNGSFRVYAVDQGDSGPSLSYLRVGKAEPPLGTDGQGKPVEGEGSGITAVPKLYDRSRDTKYTSGVGVYTQGEINVYSKGKTAFRTSGPYYIFSRGYVLTSYGERKAVSYDIKHERDVQRLNDGEIDDTQVERTLINIDWRYKRPDGWYTQTYDRGKRVDFYTSHKGEVGTSVKYGLSLGLAFNHTIAAGLDTGYSATVEVKGASTVKVTENGFESDTVFGKSATAASAEIEGHDSVSIQCGSFVALGMMATMKSFSTVVRAAVAAQNAAFLLYEASLAGQADRTLDASQTTGDLEVEHHYGFKDAFEAGPAVYNTAIALSAVTCAAGILLAAVQAVYAKAPDVGLTPKIAMTPWDMTLSVGPTKIELDMIGISFSGTRLGMRGIDMVIGAPRSSFTL
jgi:hypothetical protein